MLQKPKKAVGISELINRVKQDLLSVQNNSEPKIFSVDEITIEINFVVNGDIESGFDLGVVTLGSQISEEYIQKVTLKMTPIVNKEQLIEALNGDHLKAQEAIDTSSNALLRGEKVVRGQR